MIFNKIASNTEGVKQKVMVIEISDSIMKNTKRIIKSSVSIHHDNFHKYFVNSEGSKAYGDGIAAAMETGYSLEVGQRSNTLVFGLKYERDMAGANFTVSSLAFRFSYSFHLFRKRRSD